MRSTILTKILNLCFCQDWRLLADSSSPNMSVWTRAILAPQFPMLIKPCAVSSEVQAEATVIERGLPAESYGLHIPQLAVR